MLFRSGGLTSQVPGLSSVTGSLGSLTTQLPSVSGIAGPITNFGQTVTNASGLPTSIGGITTGGVVSKLLGATKGGITG